MSRLSFDEAVARLRRGEVVALPTDTVYGLAGSLAHPGSLESIFELKGRPASVALPVMVDDVATLEAWGVHWPERASRLSERYWPGALTVVVAAPAELAALVGGDGQTVGFRVPGDDVIREVLAATGPLAVTSANAHGSPPCTSADEVLAVFADHAAFAGVLDGGRRDGAVSTVVEVTELGWRILREGALGEDELAALLG